MTNESIEAQPGAPGNFFERALGSRYLREPVLLILAYIPYFFARGHAVDNTQQAFLNAGEVMDLERSIGLFREISLQGSALSITLIVHVANLVYFYGHWPVIFVCGLYLFIKNPRVYYITRNAFLISGAFALVAYILYPVAPPRLSTDGIIDTLSMTVPVSLDKSRLVNPYAAMPSLHVGWDLLLALGLFVGSRRIPVRIFAILLPPSMLTATVITGNHFFIDGIIGASLGLGAFALAAWLSLHWASVRARLVNHSRPSATA